MIVLIAAFITSFFICYYSIPSLIKIAKVKNLYDEPGERKFHKSSTPTLGGMGIFAAYVMSAAYWVDSSNMPELQYIICALVLMFFAGMKDDLMNMSAKKKLIAQLLASWVLVHSADIRLTSMYGILGFYEIPIILSYIISMFAIVGLTNSFNLIDGIDLLAATIGIIATSAFGFWFSYYGFYDWGVFCFAMAGALFAFGFYNKSPSRIFMGDTGALIVGIICSILAIKFVELNKAIDLFISGPTIAVSILIIPIFDTFRVFFIRLLNNRSPLSADRNHIHHILVDGGMTHMKATTIIGSVNIIVIIFAYFFRDIGVLLGIEEYSAEVLLVTIFLVLSFLTSFLKKKSEKKERIAKKGEKIINAPS